MGRHRHCCELIALILFAAGTSRVQAGPIFFGPTPYLSTADVPAGFYAGGPTAVETFEDGNLNFGITATAGSVIGPGGLTDSVDADDGSIDGFGSGGRSWFVFSSSSPTEVTFSFGGPLPSAAGLVWTDGYGMVMFEAFGPGMVSLGTIGPLSVTINPNHSGSTFEDRFYGVQYDGGIQALKISNGFPGGLGGIEVDHVQFGAAATAVPEPSSLALISLGALSLAAGARRRSAGTRSC